jgi:hypothetical protein
LATVEECRAALRSLAGRLGGEATQARKTAALTRTVSAAITDLGVTFVGQLRDGRIEDVTTDSTANAQIRLRLTSEDLLALADGTLSFPAAWAAGRVKIDASIVDLMKLRSLL